jgi:hypothetical protein
MGEFAKAINRLAKLAEVARKAKRNWYAKCTEGLAKPSIGATASK